MRIILDTSVLWNPTAVNLLAETGDDVIIPTVVFAERARQFRKKGYSVRDLRIWLSANQFEIESMDSTMAVKYSSEITDDTAWNKLSRDSLIAGHISEDDQLWTSNLDDFIEIGVPPANIFQV